MNRSEQTAVDFQIFESRFLCDERWGWYLKETKEALRQIYVWAYINCKDHGFDPNYV